MVDAQRIEEIRVRYQALTRALDERRERLWAAAEAKALGRGGIAAVTKATGIRGKRIAAGIRELKSLKEQPQPPQEQRIRRPGAGRKELTEIDETLWSDLEKLIEPETRGDPESPLRWTTKSTQHLADELSRQGHEVSDRTVAKLLKEHDYSLQATRKTREGQQDPDRDAQFKYINRQTKKFLGAGQPVISVDTKKKELVGDFANKGRDWHPKGDAPRVRVHDFIDPTLGKAIPYGVYDLDRNEGWVSVGIDHDTAAFAVATIRSWWKRMGSRAYPRADRILIIPDAGGSNGPRNRLWRSELQKFADEMKLSLSISHMPPGTSKWNKIEHRLFSYISQNWRGRPLVDHETIVNCIASTATTTGLRVKAKLDRRRYPAKVKISNDRVMSLRVRRARFRGDWNYAIKSTE